MDTNIASRKQELKCISRAAKACTSYSDFFEEDVAPKIKEKFDFWEGLVEERLNGMNKILLDLRDSLCAVAAEYEECEGT